MVKERAKAQEVICPKCNTRGGVRARRDAFVDYKMLVKPRTGEVVLKKDVVSEQDCDTKYECFGCGAELTPFDIENANVLTERKTITIS